MVRTFVEDLYAAKYEGEACDELDRLLKAWADPEFLVGFFTEHEKDLAWFGVDAEAAVEITRELVEELEDRFLQMSATGNVRLVYFFRPLHDSEFAERQMSSVKGRMRWLRLYGVRVEKSLYVISGGAIKLTQTMGEREHTRKELRKLESCRAFLIGEGVSDGESFVEFLND